MHVANLIRKNWGSRPKTAWLAIPFLGVACTLPTFYIFAKNPTSAYHLSLALSYPNVEDAERGLREGLITKAQHDQIVRAIQIRKASPQYTPLGGLIHIHGNGAQSDWTWGCVALENGDIKELYDAVDVGTPVTIKP